jgi:hypothetical protein
VAWNRRCKTNCVFGCLSRGTCKSNGDAGSQLSVIDFECMTHLVRHNVITVLGADRIESCSDPAQKNAGVAKG